MWLHCSQYLQANLREIFDVELVDELEGVYATTIWSELEEGLKIKMVESLKNSLTVDKITVPSEKYMLNRLKGFYSNRRSTVLISDDNKKKKIVRQD